MSENIITVKNLYKKFKDDNGSEFLVLKDVTFSIDKGDMVALTGVSGAGKTTLLQIIGGLDTFNEGEVIVKKQSLQKLTIKELAEYRNRQIGFVFQFHHLLPDFTAIENIILPGLINGKKKKECINRGEELLEVFHLSSKKNRYPSELSGGERQRIALARALFNNPSIILADEPTGNLDKGNGEILLEYFKKVNLEMHQTFLIATHNPELSAGVHRVINLVDGKIV